MAVFVALVVAAVRLWSPEEGVTCTGRSSARRGERRLTDFAGRPGYLGELNGSGGEFLYFTWNEDHGDLWVMDAEQSH